MNFLIKQARKKLIKQIKNAVVNTHNDGRLKFVSGDKLEFVEQDGKIHMLTAAECAAVFWQRWNDKMVADVGSLNANLATFEISPDDIKEMILELKENKKEA